MVLDKVCVWVMPNGNISTTAFFSEAKLKDESDDQFIEREMAKLLLTSEPTARYFIKDRAEVKAAIAKHPESNKRSVSSDINGKLITDKNFVSDEDKLKQSKLSIRNKLKSLLTDKEIDVLLR